MRRFLIFLLSVVALAVPATSWEASTSGNLAINVTAGQAITGVGLSNSTFTGGAASGTVVGPISVTMSPASPAFSGSLSLSGTNASQFQIVGSNLETNGAVPAGTYSINIVATETGATGSPLTQAETVTGTTPGGDPTVGLLPSDRDAYTSWSIAGLTSVGGIPARTMICATLNPSGGDDTSQIQTAVNNCTSGKTV